ncbi:MAG: hypothetical protein V1656_02095 [Candidatus Jorgensenbacteria bacterium]
MKRTLFGDYRVKLAAAYADKDGIIHEFVYSVPVVLDANLRGNKNQKLNRMIRFPNETRGVCGIRTR